MTLSFQPAARRGAPLLIGIAGPSGAGKTYSALRVAQGLAGDRPIAYIDTERGRALHYADHFTFQHAELDAPFSPEAYMAALDAAEALDPAVIVVDSGSHEHAGVGGVLDMHEAELERLAGDDHKRREAMKFAAWVKPKGSHKAFVDRLTRLRTHLIIGLRAEEKIELVRENGKMVVKPKRTGAGHVGLIPICGRELPYELTISLVVTPENPGVPQPIKLPEDLKALVPLDRPLDESVGVALGAWAAGGQEAGPRIASPPPADLPYSDDENVLALRSRLHEVALENGAKASFTAQSIADNANSKTLKQHVDWLGRCIKTVEKSLAEKEAQAKSPFKPPAGVAA